MGRKVPIRLMAISLAAGSLMLLPFAAPANAAAPAASCKKFVAGAPKVVNKVLTSKTTYSLCTPTATTGGSATGTTQIGVKVKGKVVTLNTTVWAAKKGTTVATFVYTVSKTGLGNCPAGSLERVTATGTITSSTNKAFKVGAKESAAICLAKTTAGLGRLFGCNSHAERVRCPTGLPAVDIGSPAAAQRSRALLALVSLAAALSRDGRPRLPVGQTKADPRWLALASRHGNRVHRVWRYFALATASMITSAWASGKSSLSVRWISAW